MIPKIIHYCWFGSKEKPKEVIDTVNKWKKLSPGFQFIEWNESNFDINVCDYVREAYQAKKWAFVSDYARLQALVQYGGVYLDTDVEMIKPFDVFLSNQAFMGFERAGYVGTGIIGAEKGFKFFSKVLQQYRNLHFILEDGKQNIVTNVEFITKLLWDKGLIGNDEQYVENIHIYPINTFCAKDYETGQITANEETYSIHNYAGTWKAPEELMIDQIHRIMYKIPITGSFLGKICAFPVSMFFKLKTDGFNETKKYYTNKLLRSKSRDNTK